MPVQPGGGELYLPSLRGASPGGYRVDLLPKPDQRFAMSASSSLKFLTGAPSIQSLKWTEEELLPEGTLLPQFLSDSSSRKRKHPLSSTHSHPAWRSIPCEEEQLSTGRAEEAQDPESFDSGTTFLTLRNPSFIAVGTPKKKDEKSSYYEGTEELEEYCEEYYAHSYAVHDNESASSQKTEVFVEEDTYLTAKSSFESTSSSPSPSTSDSANDDQVDPSPTPRRKPIPSFGYPIDLSKVPSTAQLVARGIGNKLIVTRTVQVDLVVGIIDIAPTRTVYPKGKKTRKELVEIIVADETKSGFGVTLWFEPLNGKEPTGMRKTVEGLRLRDVILLRNIGLAIFRKCVHGNSLPNNWTKLELLWREEDSMAEKGVFRASELRHVDPGDRHVAKVKRVKDHFAQFIVAGLEEKTSSRDRHAGSGFTEQRKPQLPPDTQ